MNELVINLLQFTFIHPTKMKASDKHSDLSDIRNGGSRQNILFSNIERYGNH